MRDGWISSEGPFVTEFEERWADFFGTLLAVSVYSNKSITTVDVGMVRSSDAALTEKLRAGRNLAFGSERRFVHTELAHNYRMTNLQAAVGVAQVAAIDRHLALKRE